MSWFEGNGWVIWLALALTLGAVEAATVDLVFLMLAGGAVAGSAAAVAGFGVPVQVISAVVVALALLGLARPAMKKRMLPELDTGLGMNAHVGAEAMVLAAVDANGGRIKLGGEEWSARASSVTGATIPPGARVKVVAISGATAVVVPADTRQPTALGELGELRQGTRGTGTGPDAHNDEDESP